MYDIPEELLEAVKDKIQILLQAIEAEEEPEKQLAYRTMVATGRDPGQPEKHVQIIVEICTDEKHFLPDGDIFIITDPRHAPEPYKTIKAL